MSTITILNKLLDQLLELPVEEQPEALETLRKLVASPPKPAAEQVTPEPTPDPTPVTTANFVVTSPKVNVGLGFKDSEAGQAEFLMTKAAAHYRAEDRNGYKDAIAFLASKPGTVADALKHFLMLAGQGTRSGAPLEIAQHGFETHSEEAPLIVRDLQGDEVVMMLSWFELYRAVNVLEDHCDTSSELADTTGIRHWTFNDMSPNSLYYKQLYMLDLDGLARQMQVAGSGKVMEVCYRHYSFRSYASRLMKVDPATVDVAAIYRRAAVLLGMTPERMGEFLGTGKSTVARYMKGTSKPGYDKFNRHIKQFRLEGVTITTPDVEIQGDLR